MLGMGCFLETSAIILLITPVFLPVIIALGMDPVWFGVIMIINTSIGMITPPMDLNAAVSWYFDWPPSTAKPYRDAAVGETVSSPERRAPPVSKTDFPPGPAKILLTADAQGHFHTTGTVNGMRVLFIVDTGATLIALGAGNAR
jgi:predicted aspartyl protease